VCLNNTIQSSTHLTLYHPLRTVYSGNSCTRGDGARVRPTLAQENVPRMFRGLPPPMNGGYIGDQEMGNKTRYRSCFIQHICCEFIKEYYIFYNIFLSNVKEKNFPKVFWVFKNGQKKCPKMKRGEIVWEKQHL